MLHEVMDWLPSESVTLKVTMVAFKVPSKLPITEPLGESTLYLVIQLQLQLIISPYNLTTV